MVRTGCYTAQTLVSATRASIYDHLERCKSQSLGLNNRRSGRLRLIRPVLSRTGGGANGGWRCRKEKTQ